MVARHRVPDPNIPSLFLICDPDIILCSGGVGASGHPDHPDDPQQRDHQEPQDLPFQAWRKQMVEIKVERKFFHLSGSQVLAHEQCPGK